MTAIWIASVIVLGIVAIVALCLYHVRKFCCQHKWEAFGQVEATEGWQQGPQYRKLYYVCRCSKCGKLKSFRPVQD